MLAYSLQAQSPPGSKVALREIKLLQSLASGNVEFYIYGGFALTCLGIRPATTPINDIDIALNRTNENLTRFKQAIHEFASQENQKVLSEIDAAELGEAGTFFSLSNDIPVDFSLSDSPQEFSDAYHTAQLLNLDGVGQTIRVKNASAILQNMYGAINRANLHISIRTHCIDLLETKKREAASGKAVPPAPSTTEIIGAREIWFLSFFAKRGVPFVVYGSAAMLFHKTQETIPAVLRSHVMLTPTMQASAAFALAMEDAARATGKVVTEPFDRLKFSKPNVSYAPDKNRFDLGFKTAESRTYFDAVRSRASTVRLPIGLVPFISADDQTAIFQNEILNFQKQREKRQQDCEAIKMALAENQQ